MARQMAISIVKASDKTSIEHNNRSMSRSELNKLKHIDQDRLNKNEYLVDIPIEEIYEKEFGEALQKYNDKQKRNDRKIDNYYKHMLQSNKHMPQQEIIFQVGEQEDFAHEQTREMAKDILRDHFERFQKDNPSLKIYNAVIHDDEATPHLHINFVPVANGYKRGLEKQVSFDRALIQQDLFLDKKMPFTEWRANQVMDLENALNEQNISRKIVGTKDFKNQKEFKLKKDLENEILGLRSERTYIQQETTKEQDKLSALKSRSEQLDKIAAKDSDKALNYANQRLKHVKPTLLNKDIVQIPKKDLDDLENAFKSASMSNQKVLRENKRLRELNKEFSIANKDLSYNNKYAKSKIDSLENDLTIFKNRLSYDESVFELVKPILIKHHDQIQRVLNASFLPSGLKNLCKGFVSGTLADKNYSYARKVAQYSNSNSFELALEKYEIGSTVAEHELIKTKEIERNQSRNLGMTR